VSPQKLPALAEAALLSHGSDERIEREMSSSHRVAPSLTAAASILLATSVAHADPSREVGQHFTVDPVADGVITIGAAGFSGLLGLVLNTGEIKPVPPTQDQANNLLSIDRGAITQTIDKNANTYSDIVLWTSVGWAVLDPVLSGVRDGWDAAAVDAVMYAESMSLTLMLTDITKIAVRRPRPIDYINCQQTPGQSMTGQTAQATLTGACSGTDLELSFFSGHASMVGAITGTATYLAFIRSPHSPRPWITLGVGTALTAFVSYERVRSGNHFPTDVVTGAMAGAAIGVLVPHLHRHMEEAPPVWIGVEPLPGGGAVGLQGVF
jgi:membrane-associated phospholipid phosphatase